MTDGDHQAAAESGRAGTHIRSGGGLRDNILHSKLLKFQRNKLDLFKNEKR